MAKVTTRVVAKELQLVALILAAHYLNHQVKCKSSIGKKKKSIPVGEIELFSSKYKGGGKYI